MAALPSVHSDRGEAYQARPHCGVGLAAMTPDLHLLIAHGLHVLPVAQAGKLPLISDWPNQASTDPGLIAAWLRQWPGMNVGIATGMKSGVVVVDIDPRHGGDETLADLEHKHG